MCRGGGNPGRGSWQKNRGTGDREINRLVEGAGILLCLGFVEELGVVDNCLFHFLRSWHKFPNFTQNDYVCFENFGFLLLSSQSVLRMSVFNMLLIAFSIELGFSPPLEEVLSLFGLIYTIPLCC